MTLVDTNVILDVLSDDPRWSPWSVRQLAERSALGRLNINDTIYAELSARMDNEVQLEQALEALGLSFERVPRSALFLAGQCYRRYRSSGGVRTGAPPDFFIGAHAHTAGYALLTRDVRRYRTYFPDVELIAPEA